MSYHFNKYTKPEYRPMRPHIWLPIDSTNPKMSQMEQMTDEEIFEYKEGFEFNGQIRRHTTRKKLNSHAGDYSEDFAFLFSDEVDYRAERAQEEPPWYMDEEEKARWIKIRDYYYSTTYYSKLHLPPSQWKHLTPAQLDFMEYGYDRHGYRQAEENCKPLNEDNQE